MQSEDREAGKGHRMGEAQASLPQSLRDPFPHSLCIRTFVACPPFPRGNRAQYVYSLNRH